MWYGEWWQDIARGRRDHMLGSSIKALRLRLGLTQWELAEQLGVDQGRVSRWERGIENPRPASAGKVRDMILREDEARARARHEHLTLHSLRPAVLMDRQSRFLVANEPGLDVYRQRFNLDLREHPKIDFERVSALVGRERGWEIFRDSGMLKGELLLLRIFVNAYGAGHVTQYESTFEDGKLVRISAELTGSLKFPPNARYSVERVEAVATDAPDKLMVTFRGPLADMAQLV